MKSYQELIQDMKLDIIRFFSLSEGDHRVYKERIPHWGQVCVFESPEATCKIVIDTGFVFPYSGCTSSIETELPFLKNDDYYTDDTFTVMQWRPGKHFWSSDTSVPVEHTRKLFRFTKELSEFVQQLHKMSDKYNQIESKERYNKLLEKYKYLL